MSRKQPKRFRETARGKNAHVLLLIAAFQRAEHHLVEMVRDAFGRGPSRRRSRRERRSAAVILARLDAQIADSVPRMIESAYSAGQSGAEAGLHRKRGGEPLSALDTSATKILIENLTERLGNVNRVVGRQVDDYLRRATLQAALRQLEAEAPEGFAADELGRTLERRGITGFVDKAGRRWKLSTYAEMALRTTSAEALARGTADKMLERGFDLVEVIGHNCNHHPSDPGHPCVAFEGETFSLTGLSREYEHLSELPPFHPNCRHFIAPSPLAFAPAPEPEAALA